MPFGLILSSRPVLTPPAAITETQYAFQFPSEPSFSHIVVFLLPNTPLPPDTAAAVYIQLPNSNGEFKLLGAIANEKPSAIFKVRAGTGTGTSATGGAGGAAQAGGGVGGGGGGGDGIVDVDAMVDDPSATATNTPSASA
ncbi:hypothetical protein LTS18_000975, partial [Coniosporium uncinatum]